jgi:hypothetical protein
MGNEKMKTSAGDSFLTIYDLRADIKEKGEPVSSASSGDRRSMRTDFASCEDFVAFQSPSDREAGGQLVFLKGYPTRDWLNLIGSRYLVDPEFFARHLDFLSPMTSASSFTVPALPSSSWNMMQLQVTTIGSRDCERRAYKQEEIDAMRHSKKTEMASYDQELSAGNGIRVGNAMVCHCSTLDETHFAIEQQISVCI